MLCCVQENPKAVYIHCFAHALNLAVQGMNKGSPLVKDTLDTTYEVTKLIKKSPKRDAWLRTIAASNLYLDTDGDGEGDGGSGLPTKRTQIHMFCSTRYILHNSTLLYH